MSSPLIRLRLDTWLWAARFFKTRSLAVRAIKGGKVLLNGQHVKPGKEIQAGVTLKVRLGMYTKEIIVHELSPTRGPAPIAQALYEETEQSRHEASVLKERLKYQALVPQKKSRPGKHDRQKIIQFNRKSHY